MIVTVRSAEHLVHGLDAPVVLMSGRVAAWLLSRAGLAQYHHARHGDDPDVDQALVALEFAIVTVSLRAEHHLSTVRLHDE